MGQALFSALLRYIGSNPAILDTLINELVTAAVNGLRQHNAQQAALLAKPPA